MENGLTSGGFISLVCHLLLGAPGVGDQAALSLVVLSSSVALVPYRVDRQSIILFAGIILVFSLQSVQLLLDAITFSF